MRGPGVPYFEAYSSTSHGLQWRRSLACEAGECLEVAAVDGRVLVRDSGNRMDQILAFSVFGWQSFVARVKDKHSALVSVG